MPIRVAGKEAGPGLGERIAVDPDTTCTLYFGSRNDGLLRSNRLRRSRSNDGHNGQRAQAKRRTRNVATIHDVAAHAGVSKMTVSRVVNGEGYVRTETRAMVLKAVKELQYLPNPAARSLAQRGRRARRAALQQIRARITSSEFLVGALEAASRNGVQLVLEKCETSDPAAARAAVHKLIKGGLGGMVPALAGLRVV